ncbi:MULTISPECIES: hypothetical protein [Pseudomonas]|uniref:hypothetical protein n=1 Tax=Pseudomonas TaxID=286 RepID=UPI000785A942|nr:MULTISPECIES: hypothetical protein [Pseudomonas]KXG79481.1 hypothetical protein AXZ07_05285 [Pseudomonas mosselii]OWQ36115.1 hypothetical protein CC207_11705 [Pseudomonas sp. DrBHI1]
MKKSLLLTAGLLLGGCAGTQTLPDPQIRDGLDYLPPITVMVDSLEHSYELRNYLRESGVFSSVESGSAPEGQTQVMVKLDAQRKVAPMPLLFLSAATLFLLPLQSDMDTKADFTVMRDGKVLNRYHYENYMAKYAWLLDLGIPERQENIRRVARAFARDMQAASLAGNAPQAQR